MPLLSYGVLRARVVDRVREGGADESPHYQLHLVDDVGTHFRASVNVKSQESPSELLYLCDTAFAHPVLEDLDPLPGGWTPLPQVPGGAALDFIRANLFDPATMRALPHEITGPENDLSDVLDHYVLRASRDDGAEAFVFGEPWLEPGVPDKVFGFPDGAGVHDVHMNQGNTPQFAKDDGVWQDGALLLHFRGSGQWVGVFLAFQSQEWHTHDTTGHRLGVIAEDAESRVGDLSRHVRVVAAMPTPEAADRPETVTILDTTPEAIKLDGWSVADREKNKQPLSGTLEPGECVRIPLAEPVRLGSKGGAITVLNPEGLKIDGVAYTGQSARAKGWTVGF